MNNNKGFNLVSVIIIIVITSITSAITAGIIVTNNYGLSYSELASDKNLNDFLKAYSNIVNNYYEDIDKEKMLDSALDAMLKYLGDDYTTYLNDKQRKELNDRLSGTYKGIGITIKEGAVESVTKGGPAEAAGVLAGDKFYKIDGQDVTKYGDNGIVLLIKNSGKEKVKLIMLRENQEIEFEIPLKTLEDVSVIPEMVAETNIGYLKIDIFSETIANQVKNAIDSLKSKGMEKLVLDLRGNSGGYLDAAKETASLFLKKDDIIYSLEDKDNKEDYYDETDEHTTFPIVILMNSGTASASEILAAALKDNYGAIFE